MYGVGTPDLFSGVSRLNTLGKLKIFLKDLKLCVQKVDKKIVHFWNSLVFAFEYGANNTEIAGSVHVQAIHLRIKLSEHCGAFPTQNFLWFFAQ